MRRFLLLLSALPALSGCYSGHSLTQAAADSAAVRRVAERPDRAAFPVYLHADDLAPEDGVSPVYQLARALEQSGRYPAVLLTRPDGAAIEATLRIVPEPRESEEDLNAAKLALSGLSLFLLSWAMPQTHHFAADYGLDVRWPNGVDRHYAARCEGYSRATPDKYRDAQVAARALRRTACLNALANRMGDDHARMTRNLSFQAPDGRTSSDAPAWGQGTIAHPPAAEAVCTTLGFKPGSKGFAGCLMGVY